MISLIEDNSNGYDPYNSADRFYVHFGVDAVGLRSRRYETIPQFLARCYATQELADALAIKYAKLSRELETDACEIGSYIPACANPGGLPFGM